MAQVGGRACSASAASLPSACSSGCELWRPAQEILQFLTECTLPPPLLQLQSADDSFRPQLLTASAVAPVSSKRLPPARWEPPAQMKIMRPDVSSELPSDAPSICREKSTEKAVTCQDLSPKPSVGSNSPCSKNDSFVQAASSECSQQASRPAAIDVWQFPRPSKVPTCNLEQHLSPPHSAGGNRKCDAQTGSSRTNPKESNAFARVACTLGFHSAEPVESSPLSIKASGFEACASHTNSFEAFASRRHDEVVSIDAQRVLGKTEKAAKTATKSAFGVQGSSVSAQAEEPMPVQSDGANAVSEKDEAAALDLLVNAIRAASSARGKNLANHDKEAALKNAAAADYSSKAQKVSYFVHGGFPFKQKRITRRAKSSYQRNPAIHKENADNVTAINPPPDPIPAGCHKIRIRTTLKGKDQYPHRFEDQETLKSVRSPQKKEKHASQQHRSLEAILFGNASPTVQSQWQRTKTFPLQCGQVMASSTVKKRRTSNLRRSSDIWRFHDQGS